MSLLNYRKFIDFIYEAEGKQLPVEIGDETVGAVKDTDADSINGIKRIARSASGREGILLFLVDTVGIPQVNAKFLYDILGNGDTEKQKEYFSNRDLIVDDIIGKVQDAAAISSEKLGLDASSTREFFDFTWNTSPKMGK